MTTNPIPHYIAAGSTPPAQCPGMLHVPQAQPGHLCVYEGVSENVSAVCVFNPVNDTCGAAAVRGFGVAIAANTATEFLAEGSWALTAP